MKDEKIFYVHIFVYRFGVYFVCLKKVLVGYT